MILEVFSIIDGINAKKNAIGMTNQQIADESKVPKSTVDRVLGKRTENPTMQVILDIAGAVGYDLVTPAKVQNLEAGQDNPYVRHIISMYECQIAGLERQYNRVTAEKDRWIWTLAAIIGLMGTGIIAILLIDLTNPNVGWFQHDTDPFALVVLAIGLLLSVAVLLLRRKSK